MPRQQPQSPPQPAPTSSVDRPAFHFGELGWLFAPVIVAATFAAIVASDRPHVSGKDVSRQGIVRWPTVLTAEAPPPSTESNRDRATAINGERFTQRPEWTTQPPSNDGLSERIVITSHQYSTREEAEQELLSVASELLQHDLGKLFPGDRGVSKWQPTAAAIKQFAVKQQYVEAADRDFGSFVHPMYRVFWQLELSPEVRMEFLPMWRQDMTTVRMQRVGLIATSLVLVFSLLAFYQRGRLLTAGKIQTLLQIFTGMVSALVVMAWIYAVRTGIF